VLDPEVLAGVPEGEALQSIVQEVQQWIKNVFDALLTASPEKIGQSLQEQVEQQLYEVMLAAIASLPKDTLAHTARKFSLWRRPIRQ